MGNTQQQQLPGQSFSLASFESNYTFYKEVQDKRFGQIKLYKTKSKPKSFIMVVTKSSLEGNYENLIQEFKIRNQLKHENICQIFACYQDNLQKLCGTSNNLTIYCEYEKNTLEKEIKKKMKTNEYFSEPELWYILDSVTKANVFFEMNRIVHGDLHAENIFVDSNGFVKIADNSFLAPYKNCLTKTLIDSDKRYLAPELLEKVSRKDFSSAYSWKHDVFTFGMTLLQAASLNDLSSCYEGNQINLGMLNTFIAQLRGRYAQSLLDIIVKMLHFSPLERISWGGVNQILETYRNKTNSTVVEQHQNYQIKVKGPYARKSPQKQQTSAQTHYSSQYEYGSGEQSKTQQHFSSQYQQAQQVSGTANAISGQYYATKTVESQEQPMIYKSNYIPQGVSYQAFQHQGQMVEESAGYLKNEGKQEVMVRNAPAQQNFKLSYVAPQNYASFQQVSVQQKHPQPLPQPIVEQQRVIEAPVQIRNVVEQHQPIAYKQPVFVEQRGFIEQPQAQAIAVERGVYNEQQMHFPQQTVYVEQPKARLVETYNEQPRNFSPHVAYEQKIAEANIVEAHNLQGYNVSQRPAFVQSQVNPAFYSSGTYAQYPTYYSNNLQMNQLEQITPQINYQQNYVISQEDENKNGQQDLWYNSSDLDKRIQEALKASEDTLQRNREYLLRSNDNE